MAEEVRAVIRSDQRSGRLARLVWALGVAILVGVLVWWLWPDAEPIHWQTHGVDRGDMVLTATATGNLAPKSEVTVGAEISGLIREVWVSENDAVEMGAVLARFDTAELQVILEQSEARLALAIASVAEAEATLAEAAADERRKVELVGRGVASQAELDIARAGDLRAAARLTSARAGVREADAAVSAARTRLDKAVIRSPINGVVLKRNIEPGNTVAASFQAPELFLLAEDLREMELHVSLDEADVGLVRAGQTATFTVDAWPDREFQAEVLKVFLYPSVQANVVSYTTVLTVDNADQRLLPGMTATATIITDAREQVLRVPNLALRFQPRQADTGRGMLLAPPGMRGDPRAPDTGNTLWVLHDGVPQRIAVRTGYTDGLYTEVLSDELKVGDEVLIGARG
jgi:HlyD family secretion protein